MALPLLDTHVHLWDLAHPELIWNWIDTDADHPILGNIDPIKMQAFTMTHLEAESRFATITGFVHVQAAIGSPDPVTETDWLTEMAQAHPLLKAVVAQVDLAEPSAAETIDRHLASPLMRGVRDFAIEPYLASGERNDTMENSLARLAGEQLVLDLDCEFPNMPRALDLARRHPELTIVLEHIGFPRTRTDDYFDGWRAAMLELGTAPNVYCKISGLGMTDPRFTPDSLRRWVDTCVEAFTPERCMFGSNWPLDRLFSSYDAIATTVRELISGLTEEEQNRIGTGTAAQVYRL